MKGARLEVGRNSSAVLSAREVRRMAIASLAEIDANRRKAMDFVWNKIKNEQCEHWFGLVKHPRFPTRQDAEEHSEAYNAASKMGWSDYNTCELLRDFAEKLLDEDPNATMTITVDDFRALS